MIKVEDDILGEALTQPWVRLPKVFVDAPEDDSLHIIVRRPVGKRNCF
jgi:hypothetical protein